MAGMKSSNQRRSHGKETPSYSAIAVRSMTASDLLFADSVRALAGWNQTLDDWQRLLTLSPEGCFIAEWNGTPAGTATTISYDEKVAWIGMLLVHPDFRSRGVGRALLERCLEYFERRGISCIKLDATPQGQPLYDRFGFKEEWRLTRWETRCLPQVAPTEQKNVYPCTEHQASAVAELDRTAFGVRRQPLLRTLLSGCERALLYKSSHGIAGYGIVRQGSRAYYLGPLVADNPSTAAGLVAALLRDSAGKSIYWDIPDQNNEAVALAKHLGFNVQRHFRRLYLGTSNIQGCCSTYFGIADPALG